MTSGRVITLTTDFGLQDAYVAVMKGVILSIVPHATIVDGTHEIAPQDVDAGSYLLNAMWKYFPADAIHIAVVDPGVGAERRPVAVRAPHGIFIGPDNGLLAPTLVAQEVLDPATGLLLAGEAVVLRNPAYRLEGVSNTFHGRDIFAPAAAYLASGVQLSDLGPASTHLEPGITARVSITSAGLTGTIQHVDHFGNLVSNLLGSHIPSNANIEVGELVISGVSRSYQEQAISAIIGSSGFLEIAARNGNAAEILGLGRGSKVTVRSVD